MRIKQTVKMAFRSILGNKMRSFLTMLGMIIGVASVIILISLMQGMTNYMISSFESFGTNNVSVTLVGRNGVIPLQPQDFFDYAKKHADVIVGVTPSVSFRATLKKETESIDQANITGVGEDYATLNKKTIENGRFLQYADITARRKVCVIGSYINQKLWNRQAKPGDLLKIDGEAYEIVGILKEESNSLEYSSDKCIYLPYTTAARQAQIGTITNYSIQVIDSNHVTQVTEEIERYLYEVFHDTDAYSVTNMIDILKEINAQLAMMTLLLAGIAGISLFVAGIGIMNIMLVSVTERTREIGIRKSLGAKKKDIMRQFVIEAATTSSIGGGIGIAFGAFVAISIGKAIGFTATPTTATVCIAFGISAAIGIIFGYLPANKAAKLNPIDALRSE